MKVTGLCAVMAAVMAATTTFAAPLPTGLEAAGVAVAMAEDGEAILAASAGVAVSFHGENITLEQKETPAAEEHAAVAAMEARQAAEDAYYKGIAISQVDNYVNIRSAASANAEVVGKIYNNAAAHIVDTVENDEGAWYEIQSGSVEGYIKADYFVTGDEAEELAREVGKMVATISTDTLRMREKPALESATVTLLSENEKYEVKEELGDFVKLSIDDDVEGYIYRDYANVTVEFKEAISIEEEKAELERLAEIERARQEAEREMEREREQQSSGSSSSGSSSSGSSSSSSGSSSSGSSSSGSSSNSGSSSSGSSNSSSSNSGSSSSSSSSRYDDDDDDSSSSGSSSSSSGSSSSGSNSSSGSATGNAIASFASGFAGQIPYVYGGNSLSSGVDCSGFVQQVFAHYGIDLPRTSDAQGSCGYSVSSSEMRPGDIVYYGGHVAIYIGDGTVVHASNPENGIRYSSWNYRTPISIRRVIG